METGMGMGMVLALVYLDRAQWRLRCINNRNLPHPHLEFPALRAIWSCKAQGSAAAVPVLGAGEECCLGDEGGVWGGSAS